MSRLTYGPGCVKAPTIGLKNVDVGNSESHVGGHRYQPYQKQEKGKEKKKCISKLQITGQKGKNLNKTFATLKILFIDSNLSVAWRVVESAFSIAHAI